MHLINLGCCLSRRVLLRPIASTASAVVLWGLHCFHFSLQRWSLAKPSYYQSVQWAYSKCTYKCTVKVHKWYSCTHAQLDGHLFDLRFLFILISFILFSFFRGYILSSLIHSLTTNKVLINHQRAKFSV